MYVHSGMNPNRNRIYKSIRRLSLNTEAELFEEFEQICYQQRKTVTEVLNDYVLHTVEDYRKRGIG